jgi:hypothetical protein
MIYKVGDQVKLTEETKRAGRFRYGSDYATLGASTGEVTAIIGPDKLKVLFVNLKEYSMLPIEIMLDGETLKVRDVFECRDRSYAV